MDFKKLSQKADDFFMLPENGKSVEEMTTEVSNIVLSYVDNLFANKCGFITNYKAKEIEAKLKVIKRLRDIMCAELGLDVSCCDIKVGINAEIGKSFCVPLPNAICKEYCIISIPVEYIANDDMFNLIFEVRHELEHFRSNFLMVRGEKYPIGLPYTCLDYGEKGMIAYDSNPQEFRCNSAGIKAVFKYLTGAKALMQKRQLMYERADREFIKAIEVYWHKQRMDFSERYYAALKKGGHEFASEIMEKQNLKEEADSARELLFASLAEGAVINQDESFENYEIYKLLYEKFGGMGDLFSILGNSFISKCMLYDYKYSGENAGKKLDEGLRYVLKIPKAYYELGEKEFFEAVKRDIEEIAESLQDASEWE